MASPRSTRAHRRSSNPPPPPTWTSKRQRDNWPLMPPRQTPTSDGDSAQPLMAVPPQRTSAPDGDSAGWLMPVAPTQTPAQDSDSARSLMPTPPAAPMNKHKMVTDLSDKLLRDVFVHLPTGTDIVRSAVACDRFLRVAASPEFRGQFRLRPGATRAPFLAVFNQPRSYTIPAAMACGAVYVSLDFLGNRQRLSIADCRDGRLLLVPDDTCGQRPPKEYFVCNPLAGTCIELPPPPSCAAYYYIASGFIPDDHSHEFRVAMLLSTGIESHTVSLRVYNSKTHQWASGRHAVDFPIPTSLFLLRHPSVLVGGCWHILLVHDRVVAVDVREMRVSSIPLPEKYHESVPLPKQCRSHVIGKSPDGKLFLTVHREAGTVEIWTCSEADDGAKEFIYHRSIPLVHPKFQAKEATLVGFAEASGLLLFYRDGQTLQTLNVWTSEVSRQLSISNITDGFMYEMEWPPTSNLQIKNVQPRAGP